MKRTIHALAIALMALITASAAVLGCTTATAQQLDERSYEFRDISDYFAPRVPSGATRILAEQEQKAAQEAQEAAQQAEAEQAAYEHYESYYEPYAPSYTGDGFAQDGVREYNGRTETWYSSNQAYHYRTSEWTVDGEGYYRDDAGHYVVAASDMPEGTVFEGSKGECIVLDSGAEAGVTDYYTAF